jgi:2-polyprenyl-6-methoxyphenol hydroxylase-like FAD-dependent oxidoreductase
VPTTHHDVIIAGGGPTGLMLAAELALARVDVAIVERRENPDLPNARGLVRAHPARHHRLSHPSQLRPRAMAAAHGTPAG